MRLTVKTTLLAVLACCAIADSAFAWGPATHIGLGESVLSQIALLPASIAALLGRHAVAYLYGNIAADVVFAKRWSRVKQFCHHWSTGFRLLDSARDDRAKAFAYGYLSHLAADTVAHGKYVPRQIVMSECSQNFGHFYWELRADSAQSDPAWRRLADVIRVNHDEHHTMMRRHITDTLLSYPVNRLLFDRMNALTVRQTFRCTIHTWGWLSRWPLPQPLLNGYQGESLDRIMSVLVEGSRSPVLREDPNGTSALMQVRIGKVDLRRRKRRGLPVERRLFEASVALAPRAQSNAGAMTIALAAHARPAPAPIGSASGANNL
jgi:hypothetical protein